MACILIVLRLANFLIILHGLFFSLESVGVQSRLDNILSSIIISNRSLDAWFINSILTNSCLGFKSGLMLVLFLSSNCCCLLHTFVTILISHFWDCTRPLPCGFSPFVHFRILAWGQSASGFYLFETFWQTPTTWPSNPQCVRNTLFPSYSTFCQKSISFVSPIQMCGSNG